MKKLEKWRRLAFDKKHVITFNDQNFSINSKIDTQIIHCSIIWLCDCPNLKKYVEIIRINKKKRSSTRHNFLLKSQPLKIHGASGGRTNSLFVIKNP